MKKKFIFLWFAKKFSFSLSILSVFPIIAHVLLPMFFILIPIAYFTWFILALPSDYMFVYFSLGSASTILGWCGRILICGGAVLLIYSLVFFVKRYENVPIVEEGPYTHIRHPQNLGILIIVVGIALTKSFEGFMILFDIISVIFFTVTLSIGSWLEEWRMVNSYPQEYLVYRNKTGMYFPRFRKVRKEIPTKNVFRRNIFVRIGITALGFIICYLSTVGLGMMILNRYPNSSVLTWGLSDPYDLVWIYLHIGFPTWIPEGMMYSLDVFFFEILIIAILPIFWILSVVEVIRMKKNVKIKEPKDLS